MLERVVALADPLNRREAARALATYLGSDELIIFINDPELGILLPAPGFPQTLPGGRAWRTFVETCLKTGRHAADLPFPGLATARRAIGVTGTGGSVLVLLGGSPRMPEVEEVRASLPLLTAAFRGERAAQIAEGHAATARETAAQARLLAESLDLARRDVQRALDEAHEARARATFVAEASALFSASLDVEAILASVTRMVVPRFALLCLGSVTDEDQSARRAALAYVDPARPDQVRQVLERHTVDGLVVEPRHPGTRIEPEFPEVLLDLIAHDEEHRAALRSLDIRSTVAAPLTARGRLIGSLWFGSGPSRHPFAAHDRELVEDLAQRAALAIDNAYLYQGAQKAIQARDEFLTIAAHELKTPVTSLVGYTQVVQRRATREKTLSERDRRGLQVIAGQAERLSRLINSLLDVSRIQSGHFTLNCRSIDLCEVIRDVADEVHPILEHHELMLECPDAPALINGDVLRLEQMLQNLIQNAIKYSPGGGTIFLSVERRTGDVAITISDQGLGIPASAVPQLFQRFYRADNIAGSNISGMGIGLFVVHEIVSRHGGRVEVNSVEGEGSSFRVYLPLLKAPASISTIENEVGR